MLFVIENDHILLIRKKRGLGAGKLNRLPVETGGGMYAVYKHGRFGWHHSGWDEIEAVQVAEDAVNVALTFSRYNADDEVISTFSALYLVTHDDGRWGIRARSSFTP